MKNLSKFEAFKLNKVQMNAIAGGAPAVYEYSCTCHSTGKTHAYFIEESSQLADASDLCNGGGVSCSYVGVD